MYVCGYMICVYTYMSRLQVSMQVSMQREREREREIERETYIDIYSWF